MDSQFQNLISQIQGSNIENGFKNTIISSFKELYAEYQKIILEKNCLVQMMATKDEQINLSKKLIETQDIIIQQWRPSFEPQPSSSNVQQISTPMDETPVMPSYPGPRLISREVTGVVKSFCVNQCRGIINYNEKIDDQDVLKDAIVYSMNIAKSKTRKPEYRTLLKGETVVFDLYDNGYGKQEAKNVSGPNGENVQGCQYKIIYRDAPRRQHSQNPRIPEQRQRQPPSSYRNQSQQRSQSRSRSIHRNQNQMNSRQNYQNDSNGFQQRNYNRNFRPHRQQ